MVLVQNKICSNIPSLTQNSSLIPHFIEKGITLTDMGCDGLTIALLLGVDI